MARTPKAVPTPTEKKVAINDAKQAVKDAKAEVARLARHGKTLSGKLTAEQKSLTKSYNESLAAIALERKNAFKAHTSLVHAADKALIAASRKLLKVAPPKSTSIMQ